MKRMFRIAGMFLAWLAVCTVGLRGQTRAVTYQGRLLAGTNGANGTYEFKFVAYDSLTGGNQVGRVFQVANVGVTNGLFQVYLDLGAEVYDGSSRWVELAVRTNGSSAAWVGMSPRQWITTTPYAFRALDAARAATVSGPVQAAQINGTLSVDQLPAMLVTNGARGISMYGEFSGSGAGLAGIPVTALTSAPSLVGAAVAWGGNEAWQAGSGIEDGVRAVACGNIHSVALMADGTITAWGMAGRWDQGAVTVPPGLDHVVGVAAGGNFTAVLKEDGTVVAFGYDDAQRPPAGLAPVKAIAAGSGTILALLRDGTVRLWGAGAPVVPTGLSDVVAVAAGSQHYLALRSDGRVVAWGGNDHGEATVPADLNDVAVVSAGYHHSLAVRRDGSVVAWGDNSSGQCDVPAGMGRVKAVAGGGLFSLALLEDGSLKAWGNNAQGQLLIPASARNVVALGPQPLAHHSVVVCSRRTLTVATLSDGHLRLDDQRLYLRSSPDVNHGLGWAGPGHEFGGVNFIDGPALFGYKGGVLGTTTGGSEHISLYWAGFGVGIGTVHPGGDLDVKTDAGNVVVRSDGAAPCINIVNSPNPGILRIRNCLQLFPSYDATRAGALDIRNTNGKATISMDGSTGIISAAAFNTTSDRQAKDNISPVDPRRVLEKVAALTVSEWQFKDAPGTRHIGPMAQDFHEAFGVGTDERHIATVDADGVALAAIQGLNEAMREAMRGKDEEIRDLRRSVAELRAVVEKLATAK